MTKVKYIFKLDQREIDQGFILWLQLLLVLFKKKLGSVPLQVFTSASQEGKHLEWHLAWNTSRPFLTFKNEASEVQLYNMCKNKP